MFIDVRKAHLHAYVDRETYVDLPPEAAQEGEMRKASPVPFMALGMRRLGGKLSTRECLTTKHGFQRGPRARKLLLPPRMGRPCCGPRR